MNDIKILSIDDSPSMRQIIKSCLVQAGYQVFDAEDGLEGFNKVKSGEIFDLILVDVNMPNMDGITFVRELRKLNGCKDIPVIILTTENQSDKKAEGKDAGATGWIVKPFEPEELIKVIKHLTQKT